MLRCPDCGRTFRRQLVRDKPYWVCSGRAAGATRCRSLRVQEEAVYDAFAMLAMKLAGNREYLLSPLIRQMEDLQARTGGSQQRIQEIDKQLADLGAQNLVIARLHTKGILTASDYAAQAADIGGRITGLRIERRKKLAEDEDSGFLDELKGLRRLLEEAEIGTGFHAGLFEQMVTGITVDSHEKLTFRLIGGLELAETIHEKGRCKTA